jgi:hypothetical protein
VYRQTAHISHAEGITGHSSPTVARSEMSEQIAPVARYFMEAGSLTCVGLREYVSYER